MSSVTPLTPAPGSNLICYTSFPARDSQLTNISACNAEVIHQRSLCVAAVDIAAETIRANMVVANEIIVQNLIQPPTSAGIFSTTGTALTASSGTLEAYDNTNFTLVLVADAENVDVALNGTADGVVVDRDGWYQISTALSNVVVSAGSSAVWGITVNGITTNYPVDTAIVSSTTTVRGSIGVQLVAGDVVGLSVTTTAPANITVPASPNILTIVRVGS